MLDAQCAKFKEKQVRCQGKKGKKGHRPYALLPGLHYGNINLLVSANIIAEINTTGELIGIEILNAITFVQGSVLESVQAKVLDFAEAKTV